jgi:tetratricopeptide (TPR) repeat protein
MLSEGKNEEALALLQDTLASGHLPKVEHSLALAAQSKTLAEAVDHYSKAAKLAPWRAVAQRNLVLALFLSGNTDQARARLQLCYLIFQDDDSYRGIEAILEAFQGNSDKALKIVEQMKDDKSGWKTLLRGTVRPLAKFSKDLVRGLCGAKPEMTLMDHLSLITAIAKLKLSSGGRQSAPAFSGAGPVITRGLGGLAQSMLAYGRPDKAKARETTRQALQEGETAVLWALMSVIESDLGNFEEALTASRNAQSMPSMFPDINMAARLLEGYIEAAIWMRSKDPACLARANAKFHEVFHDENLPLDAARPMVFEVAMRSGDLLFARQVAGSMAANTPQQMIAFARIEYADGNHVKALNIAEKASRLFPGNEELRTMVAKMRAGTFQAVVDVSGPN